MRTVDIYIGTSIRGAGRGDGKTCYSIKSKIHRRTVINQILQWQEEDYESTPRIAAYEDTTESELVLYSLRDAVRRMNYAVRMVVHTECDYIVSAVTQRWPWNWQQNGWKTSRGKEAQDSVLWSDILNVVQENGHELVAVKDHHDYLEWMRWKFGTERTLRGIFTEIKEE